METRRGFMWALAGGAVALQARAAENGKKGSGSKPAAEEQKVTPAEDLMREHGVLDRLMLIYDAAGAKLSAGQDFPAEVLSGATEIVITFIQGYHEKNEETYLFPRFAKAGKLTELVDVLSRQHMAGRLVTGRILEGARAGLGQDPQRKAMAALLAQFTRMYRPHKAREDTVLFPAIRSVMSPAEYDETGEKFEEVEEQKFGEGGFEKIVAQVADLETKVGLADLAQFTPQS